MLLLHGSVADRDRWAALHHDGVDEDRRIDRLGVIKVSRQIRGLDKLDRPTRTTRGLGKLDRPTRTTSGSRDVSTTDQLDRGVSC